MEMAEACGASALACPECQKYPRYESTGSMASCDADYKYSCCGIATDWYSMHWLTTKIWNYLVLEWYVNEGKRCDG